ncbi:6-phosphogluconolactonase [Pseudomonas sp. 2FG]|uniref:6-phosphogluconolactonase n=1 Tax=Pseudomonas sp. 2FG TaxID=2502191 RepID=UPI0010FA0C3B|nr:6-phosphogluconolactonase [Pseudomonas sp. 2FG]
MNQSIFLQYPQRETCIAQLSADLGAQLQQALAEQSRASLLLPGGSSPQALLPVLAAQPVEWSRIDLSPTDERWVPADAAQSNWRLLRAGLPGAACRDPRQAAGPQQSASAWAAQLSDWLPFDAVLLGMGEDAHIASLFPAMPGLAAALDPAAAPAGLVGSAPSEPSTRLSLNLSMLLQSHWIGLLAFGPVKRRLIEAVLADEPASRPLPLYALLWHSPLPVRIYWAP